MRTAEKYLKMYRRMIDGAGQLYWVTGADFKKAINEARKEAIEECAERADTKKESDYSEDIGTYEYNVVDKQSILSLINELK